MQESPTPTKFIVPYSHGMSDSRRPKLAAERHHVFFLALFFFKKDFRTISDLEMDFNIYDNSLCIAVTFSYSLCAPYILILKFEFMIIFPHRKTVNFFRDVLKKVWDLKMVNHWQHVSYTSVFLIGMPSSLSEQPFLTI